MASKAHPHLHQLWFRPPALKRFHSRFNNAAVYRGLAHLALKQASMAANEFRSGGLHNHAAALDLIEAFEQNENDARYHLLATVQTLCEETSELYGKSMFADHTTVSNDREKHNDGYRYGLGPFSEYRTKSNTRMESTPTHDLSLCPQNCSAKKR